MIKFISYTGKYPNLCRGILTLEIDGKEYRFGHDYLKWNSWETDGNHDSFWTSSGGCWFTNDYADAHVSQGPWELFIGSNKFPKELEGREQELIDCFNENVEWGCCGGCL